MKKHNLFTLATIAIGIILFAACSKSNSTGGGTTPKTKTDLLTQASWKYSSVTVGGVDASSYIQACQKDNIYTFMANGNGTADEGPTKCNSGDPQSTSFTWNLQDAETTLFVSAPLFSGGNTSLGLKSLTETQLVVSQPTTGPGPSLEVDITFTH